jgi:hypothetical protein
LTVNLRLSLTIFKIGFAVQSAGGFVALASHSSQLPLHGDLLLLSPLFSALGILFLWLGRHEWNHLHHRRVGHASLAFAASLVAIVLAVVPIAYLSTVGSTNPPGWLAVEFGAAIAVVFSATFVTYALVASHLVGLPGRVAMGLGLAWSILISALIGLALSPQLQTISRDVVSRSPAIAPIAQPITLLDALLGFGYLAFFVAFVDAHYRVATGAVPIDS